MPMKRQPTISSLLMALVCFIVLDVSCLTAPSGAQTADQTAQGDAMSKINDSLNSNPGGSMISLTKEVSDHALGKGAIKSFGDAWKANKSGASSSTVGGLLEKSANLKNASNMLNTGGVLIDHAGYASTAAGEISEGNYAQGFITIADGLGKSVVSGLASATGAGFGTLAGPAGTIAGGAAGGYAGNEAWDKTMGQITSSVKEGLGKQEDKRRYREMFGDKIVGRTPEKIHELWLSYRQEQLAGGISKKPVAAPPAVKPPAAGKVDGRWSCSTRGCICIFPPEPWKSLCTPDETAKKVKQCKHDGRYCGTMAVEDANRVWNQKKAGTLSSPR